MLIATRSSGGTKAWNARRRVLIDALNRLDLLLVRHANVWTRHPGESRGPGDEPPPLLDSGFRRNDESV